MGHPLSSRDPAESPVPLSVSSIAALSDLSYNSIYKVVHGRSVSSKGCPKKNVDYGIAYVFNHCVLNSKHRKLIFSVQVEEVNISRS